MSYNYNNTASDIKLAIMAPVWAQMSAYVKNCSTEISGFGLVERINGIDTITELVVLPQIASSVETTIDENALIEFFTEKSAKKENWGFHWHSHPSSGNMPSGTDDKLYKQLRASVSVLRAAIFAKNATDVKVWTMFDSPVPVTLQHGFTHIAYAVGDGVRHVWTDNAPLLDYACDLLGYTADNAAIKKSINELVTKPKPAPAKIVSGGSMIGQTHLVAKQQKKSKGKKAKSLSDTDWTPAEWQEYLSQFEDSELYGGYTYER